MNNQLVWAGGSADAAHVTQANGNDLQSWVTAAQAVASDPHSIAWFQYHGNTYVYEPQAGNTGNHAGDTLVVLTGLMQFTGANGEHSIGILHLLG